MIAGRSLEGIGPKKDDSKESVGLGGKVINLAVEKSIGSIV